MALDSDPAPPRDSLLLRLDGFEGPLDLLLDLARAQKVDLAKISILSLVEQFLAVIAGAKRVRLELAADWLVMAAWLTWLKSRLLLPADQQEMEDGAVAAEALANRLRMLAEVRLLAVWLGTRPMLGQDVFARGMPEDHTEIDRTRLTLDLASLVASYLRAAKRGAVDRLYRPRALTLWTVQDAIRRLGGDARQRSRLGRAGAIPARSPDRSLGAPGGAGQHVHGGAGNDPGRVGPDAAIRGVRAD